ncbi:MAG: thioredoxin family protein [Myxococcota bacterium]
MRTNSGRPIPDRDGALGVRLATVRALINGFAGLVALIGIAGLAGCEGEAPVDPEKQTPYNTPLLSKSALRAQLNESCENATAHGQPILVEFSAPWCSDCQKLHAMKQASVLQSELAAWPFVTINVGQFDAHRGLLEAFEVEQIAHWAVLAPNDCDRPVEDWPRLAQRKLEPASGAERGATPADLAHWLLAFRKR